MHFLKYLFLVLVCFLLALWQNSFFAPLTRTGVFFNPLLMLVLVFNFWEKPEKNAGLFVGFLAGFFLDIFSVVPLGFFALIFFALSFLLKKMAVLFDKNGLGGFVLTFAFAFIFYDLCLFSSQTILGLFWPGNFAWCFPASLTYWFFSFTFNLIAAMGLFTLGKAWDRVRPRPSWDGV